jgi:phenylalanine ammonia-lyase
MLITSPAIDLRSLQADLETGMRTIVQEAVAHHYPDLAKSRSLHKALSRAIQEGLDATVTMDALPRMEKVAAATTVPLVDHFSDPATPAYAAYLPVISAFRASLAERSATLLIELRREYLSGKRSAGERLAKTRPMYDFIRHRLGIPMHGNENLAMFEHGLGVDDVTIGENVSRIYEVCLLSKLMRIRR